ncbi:MAG: hypothetical protein QXY65_02915 [Candidatus Methanomethylicaceae archaeon]
MSKWNLTYKGAEPLYPAEYNRIVDALDELDKRTPTKHAGGLATFSGDGSTTDFTIIHDLGVVPDIALIGDGSLDAIGDKWWEVTDTELKIHYSTAPPSGTDNVKIWWLVLKF